VGEVAMDGETAETLAGVVRSLQRAGQLTWVRAEGEGPRSPRQLVALGVDLVAEEVRNLLPDGVHVAGPTPIGKDEVGLSRSAEQLRHTVTGVPAAGGCGSSSGAGGGSGGGGEHPCRGLIDATPRRSCWPQMMSWPG
jgi:hypothetical protein